jgi:hypothetical protein
MLGDGLINSNTCDPHDIRTDCRATSTGVGTAVADVSGGAVNDSRFTGANAVRCNRLLADPAALRPVTQSPFNEIHHSVSSCSDVVILVADTQEAAADSLSSTGSTDGMRAVVPESKHWATRLAW